MPQCRDGIDPQRPRRREVTRGHGHEADDGDRGRQRCRIVGRHVPELIGDEAVRRDTHDQPGRDARRQQPYGQLSRRFGSHTSAACQVKRGGITPTMVRGCPFKSTVQPTTAGSAPK